MSVLEALDLSTHREPGYLEVRDLPAPRDHIQWCTVRAYVDPSELSAMGQGDSGYHGVMRDRIFRRKEHRCFLNDSDFETSCCKGQSYEAQEVLMTGFVSIGRPVSRSNRSLSPATFVCTHLWRNIDQYYEAT